MPFGAAPNKQNPSFSWYKFRYLEMFIGALLDVSSPIEHLLYLTMSSILRVHVCLNFPTFLCGRTSWFLTLIHPQLMSDLSLCPHQPAWCLARSRFLVSVLSTELMSKWVNELMSKRVPSSIISVTYPGLKTKYSKWVWFFLGRMITSLS